MKKGLAAALSGSFKRFAKEHSTGKEETYKYRVTEVGHEGINIYNIILLFVSLLKYWFKNIRAIIQIIRGNLDGKNVNFRQPQRHLSCCDVTLQWNNFPQNSPRTSRSGGQRGVRKGKFQ